MILSCVSQSLGISMDCILFIIYSGLQIHCLCPEIRKEAVMHQCTYPDGYSMWASEFLLSNEHVDSPVIIVDFPSQMPPQFVFFHPVDLKIPKRATVPAPEDREAVATGKVLAQKLFLLGQWTCFAPSGIHAGIVHPLMQ